MSEKSVDAKLEEFAVNTSQHSSEVAILDPAIERRITRRFDTHILPWIFALWLLAFIDRSNIGNAKLDGLTKDLNMTDNTKYNTALAVFYILYVLLDVPSNWLLKRVGGGKYLPALVVAWGIVGTCMGAVKSYGGLIACRILLGACEGGMFGGIILYLSSFYKRHQLMLRLGFFYCAAPLSGAFGGLLATGLGQIRFHGYNGWPWIFFIEGSITIVVGIIAGFFLPDTPGTAKFLTEEEREIAEQRLQLDSRGALAKDVAAERFSWAAARRSLLNVNTQLMSLNFFLILVPIYSYSLFLPTIISGMGYTNVTAQLFTVPPNFLAFLSVIGCCWMSDRIQKRGPMILGCITVGMVGYIMLIAAEKPGVRYAGTFFVAAGVFPCSPMVLGWLSNNLAPHYVRATGIGYQVAFGNCGAFVATFTYLTTDAPRYIKGHAINLGAIGLIMIVTSCNMAYIAWENRLRERGGRDARLTGDEKEHELGYRHPNFRYTT